MKRVRLSPVGIGMLVITGIALLAFVLGSSGVQLAGLLVILLEVAFIAVRPVFTPGLDGGWFALKTLGRGAPASPDAPVPSPDYMPEAGTASEEAWAHERELYRKKDSAGP